MGTKCEEDAGTADLPEEGGSCPFRPALMRGGKWWLLLAWEEIGAQEERGGGQQSSARGMEVGTRTVGESDEIRPVVNRPPHSTKAPPTGAPRGLQRHRYGSGTGRHGLGS